MESNSLCFALKTWILRQSVLREVHLLLGRMTWGCPPLSTETLSIHGKMALETPTG